MPKRNGSRFQKASKASKSVVSNGFQRLRNPSEIQLRKRLGEIFLLPKFISTAFRNGLGKVASPLKSIDPRSGESKWKRQ